MRLQHGLSLRETAAGVQVLTENDTLTEVPAAEFAGLSRVTVPGPGQVGAAGRLWAAQRAAAEGAVRAVWPAELISAAARSHATASLGARRAAAVDALVLGLHDVPGALGLPEPELCWYRAWAAGQAGDTTAAVGWLEQLPAGRYAHQVTLLESRAADLLAEDSLAARATALLRPFAGNDLRARALLAALDPESGRAAAGVLLDYAVTAGGAGGAGGEQGAAASAITELTRPARPFPPGLPDCQALGAYLDGRSGRQLDDPVSTLARLPLILLDELIDARAIPPSLATGDWPAHAAYIRSRLSPQDASEEDLASAGFTAELARRRYAAGDQAGLARLSADDPAVRHYQVLARWQAGRAKGELEGLRPAARHLLAAVSLLQSSAASGEEATVPELVAADPTCWALLHEQALLGALQLPAELRERYPEFADWLDLSGLQQLAYEERWLRVVSAGRALAGRCRSEAARDEAMSLTAYAELERGRPDTALQLLDQALAGEYTTGLIVNASIVAAVRGSLAALPYLARIVRLETDSRVRSGAVVRAIDLWSEDDSVTGYPEPLRELVRAALAEAQPDQVLRRLLALAGNNDRDWLAGAGTVYVSTADQAELLRYRRAWARATSDGYTETLASVAQALADSARSEPPADWVSVELPRFTDDIDEAIHCPFGEALYLAPAVEVLLDAGVLEPLQQLVLAAQAGAHVAFYLAEHDGCISVETEQRLLFHPVQRFRQEKSGLAGKERSYVARELGRCVTAAGHAMGKVVDRDFGRRTPEWNELVRREQNEPASRAQILAAEHALLDGLDSEVSRAAAYLSLTDGLEIDDNGRDARAFLAESVSTWTAEISRLRGLM